MIVETTQKRLAYLARLDVLRGLAILLVFLFHFNSTIFGPDRLEFDGWWGRMPIHWLETPSPALAYVLWYPLSFAWCGVALFFVISGFVIHWSFLNARHFSLRAFFWRRFWRIYPPYAVAVLFFLWYHEVDLRTAKGFFQAVSHLLLIHNFHPASLFGVSGVFWSLAVECQFYLIYPLVLWARRRFGDNLPGMRMALWMTLLVSVAWQALSLARMDWDNTYTNLFAWQFTLALWFDWTIGAYIAECFYNNARAFRFSVLGWPVMLLLLVAASFFRWSSLFNYFIASVFFAIVVDIYLCRKKALQWWERWLVPVGLCSYSIYLWHHPFIMPILSWLPPTGFASTLTGKWTLGLLLCSTVIFVMSWLLYNTVERFGVRMGAYVRPAVLKMIVNARSRSSL
jgi:peptidoglycan/LPS O-acetylase OafA/YrhL